MEETRSKIEIIWSVLATFSILAFKIKVTPTEENDNLLYMFIDNYLMLWKTVDKAIDYQIYRIQLIKLGIDPLKAMCLSAEQVKINDCKIKKKEYIWASEQKWPDENIIKKDIEPNKITLIIMIIQTISYLITFYIRLYLKMDYFKIELMANVCAFSSLCVIILSYKRPLCHKYIEIETKNIPYVKKVKTFGMIPIFLEIIGFIVRIYISSWFMYLMYFDFPTKIEKIIFDIGCLGIAIIHAYLYIFERLFNIINKKIKKILEIIYCILLTICIIIVFMELRINFDGTKMLIATPLNKCLPHI